MFDVGFSELIVIAVVALVVIGPERLPRVARTAGHLLGRLQRYVGSVKADIKREMQLDELKKLQTEMQDSARSFEASVRNDIQSVEQDIGQTVQSAQSAIQDLSPAATGAESVAVAEKPSPGPAESGDSPGSTSLASKA
jgi:sec-independent protein translocase protein TatB